MIFVASKSLVGDENTHRRGKDHCTDGLRINKNGFGQRRKYGVAWIWWSYLIQTSKTGDQPYWDTYPYGEGSLVDGFSARQKPFDF